MMKEKLNIDKVFRDKLEGFREKPPEYLWDGIRERMALQQRRKRMTFYSWAAVAALLALAFVAGWHFNRMSHDNMPQTAEVGKNMPQGNVPAVNGGSENDERDKGVTGLQPEEKARQYADAVPAGYDEENTRGENISEKEQSETVVVSSDRISLKSISSIKAELMTESQDVILADNNKGTTRNRYISSYDEELIAERIAAAANTREFEPAWKMGLNISPGYSSYSAKHGQVYSNKMTYPSTRGISNVSGGISVQFRAKNRLSIESGVYYAQNGQKSEGSPQSFAGYTVSDNMLSTTKKFYFNADIDVADQRMKMNSIAGVIEFEDLPRGAEIEANLERAGSYSNALITQGEFSQVFDFIEIPLFLRYLVADSKIDVELVGGVNAGLVVGNKAYINNDHGLQNIGKTDDISMVNLSGTIGIGATYALNKHISFSLEPRMNYYVNSINRDPEVDFHPYRVGIYSGLYYEF